MPYSEAIEKYGTDKPDIRFNMMISDLTQAVKGHGFKMFDDAEYTGAICAEGCSGYSRKQLDELTEFVRKPQIGAKGLVFVKYAEEGIKSSVDKYFSADDILNGQIL